LGGFKGNTKEIIAEIVGAILLLVVVAAGLSIYLAI
jgi:hypothetical protein